MTVGTLKLLLSRSKYSFDSAKILITALNCQATKSPLIKDQSCLKWTSCLKVPNHTPKMNFVNYYSKIFEPYFVAGQLMFVWILNK